MEINNILNGFMLGDGFLERRKQTYNASLKINRALIDKEYLLWSAAILQQYITPKGVYERDIFDKRTGKTYRQIGLRSKSDIIFTKLHERWYIDGVKKVPYDLVLNNEMVQIWMADDGCVIPPKDKLNKTRFDVKFATHAFSFEETEILVNKLNSLYNVEFKLYMDGIHPTIRLLKTEDCRSFLRCIDCDFPLERKAIIWRNNQYKLFEEIKTFPACAFCGGEDIIRNGKIRGEQKYLCIMCGRQFTERTTGKRIKNKNGEYPLVGKYWRKK